MSDAPNRLQVLLPPSSQIAALPAPAAPDPAVPDQSGPQPPLPPPSENQLNELFGAKSLDESTERQVDEIEMIGEEMAAGFVPKPSGISPGMRYLHCSRTIHQLVTDRNRAVGLYLAVASLLWTASTALLNVKQDVKLMVPLEVLQFWCLPVTLGTATLLALFTAFLLIRTRIGLIYEVAKMNVLLGLPIGRVQRINPLSIFFIMHLMVCVLGAGSGLLFVYHLCRWGDLSGSAAFGWGLAAGVLLFLLLLGLYVGTVLYTTSDRKLDGAARETHGPSASGTGRAPASKEAKR